MNARRPSFGVALRRARLNKKLTQQALAERLGVSDATYVSKWERNIIVPSLHYQQKLREVLGDFFEEDIEDKGTAKHPIHIVIIPIIQYGGPLPEEKS